VPAAACCRCKGGVLRERAGADKLPLARMFILQRAVKPAALPLATGFEPVVIEALSFLFIAGFSRAFAPCVEKPG